jgi:hypothetical protein
VQQVSLATNDMVYDRFADVIYASVPSAAGPPNGNSIVTIDPHSGALRNSVFIGNEPDRLAISDDGQFLYVGLDDADAIRRIDIPTMKLDIEFGLGGEPIFGGRQAGDIKVLPGQPRAVAVAARYREISPDFAGLAIFDDGVARTIEVPQFGKDIIDRIAFGDSAATLYGVDTETTRADLYVLKVDATGVWIISDFAAATGPFGSDIAVENGLIYDATGQVFDPVAKRVAGTFGVRGLVAPDSAAGKVFLLTDNLGSDAMIRVFDQQTFTPLASLEVRDTQNGRLHSFVRWGDDGLAFARSPDFPGYGSGEVFLIEEPLSSYPAVPESTGNSLQTR